ncbi:hypothetical protein CW298_3956 [Salmonella enterica subsp. enterica serovar Muenchen]|uniref:Uncharacterized protein n=8 Tax=Bacteria TaxID=2 RepID=A0A0F6B892_SALT1|nr:hypothetical protein STM14_4352 [Salmonella enterica subsp. enterica serovar Typhimurium str. 14028S]AGK69412.1 hypothetical protein TY21A_19845 [Salmonella enterica subsp. enterica serovar Typhi str. Ty21a]APT79496.1 hypothetical protein GW13_PRO2620 [Salmonella enterica subsp. enterica serovar Cerro]PQB15007.1 hypothetical protein CW298_3956 [Salmonella enterica subsp. enterica serovar Muenchen]
MKNGICRTKILITKVKKGRACASQLKLFNIFVSIMILAHFCHVVWVLF